MDTGGLPGGLGTGEYPFYRVSKTTVTVGIFPLSDNLPRHFLRSCDNSEIFVKMLCQFKNKVR